MSSTTKTTKENNKQQKFIMCYRCWVTSDSTIFILPLAVLLGNVATKFIYNNGNNAPSDNITAGVAA